MNKGYSNDLGWLQNNSAYLKSKDRYKNQRKITLQYKNQRKITLIFVPIFTLDSIFWTKGPS